MEFGLFLLGSILFTLPVVWVNRREDNGHQILTIILGMVVGTILGCISFFYHEIPLLLAVKMMFVYIWLITVAYIDGKTRRIPNGWILYGVLAWMIFFLIEEINEGKWIVRVGESLIGMVAGGGFFLASALISKGGIGMGDVKLYGVIGLILGWQRTFTVIAIALFGALIYGLVMIILRKKDRKSLIPLGPFTYLSMIILMLIGA